VTFNPDFKVMILLNVDAKNSKMVQEQ